MDDHERPDRGFRPIGSLTTPIVSSPENLVSTLERSQPSSATTGTDVVAPGRTGTRRSGTPAASSPSAIAALMVSNNPDPENTDRLLLALLPPSVAHSLTPRMRTWDDPEHGFDYEITGYSLTRPLPPDAELDRARELVAVAMRPAPVRTVAAELARLAAVTKSRADSDEDQTLRFAAFRDELAEFPQDVISAALRKIARRETFFPSLAEIRDQCQREFRHRQRLASALERRN